jgi:ribonucleoside-diphosphate reductase alpha chain
MTREYGPTLRISKEKHAEKYRLEGESFYEAQTRFASALKDSPEHFLALRNILLEQRFMGGGRTQAAIGAPRTLTAFNCFVSGVVEDSMQSIMQTATEAAQTMRLGGGIGYDFSKLRPKGDNIVSLGSRSSGPVSFMQIYDAVCKTIASAGHRRGAQMGVLRVDHPDIEEFIRAKQNSDKLTAFNISIGITDKFMVAVRAGTTFDLVFEGRVYKTVNAKNLWEEIMRSTWEWAEPGVLFIDRINEMNNLYYCEDIAATNPCGEQPLPPYGACLLGSYNLTKYIVPKNKGFAFDFEQFKADIPVVTRAMDNIHDNTTFPLLEQKEESRSKRRMGLGLTGVANAGEICGYEYGSKPFLKWFKQVLTIFRDETYSASVDLAIEKGAFPLFDKDKYLEGGFIMSLPDELKGRIKKHGIRNSHLLSIAPTGTISLTADNVSSGIEPVFSYEYDRTIQTFQGPTVETVSDYAYREYGIKGKSAMMCSEMEHLDVLALSSQYVDSAVSKTINVNPQLPWEDFKNIYTKAWTMGCKGVTTFNPSGKRFGILVEKAVQDEPEACYIDVETGIRSCE